MSDKSCKLSSSSRYPPLTDYKGFTETNFLATHLRSPKKARTTYESMECMKSEDIADAVLHILSSPEHVEIHDILMRPTSQKS